MNNTVEELTNYLDKVHKSMKRVVDTYNDSYMEFYAVMTRIVEMIRLSKETDIPINNDALILLLTDANQRLDMIEKRYNGES